MDSNYRSSRSQSDASTPRPPEEKIEKDQGKINRIGLIAMGIAALVLTGLVVRSALARNNQQQENALAAKAEANHISAVQVITPQQAPEDIKSELPGSVVAVQETTINARTNGFLKQRFVDIGYRVKAGQLLADIESPDVDQQVSQAEADLAKAQASAQQARADLSKAQSTLVQNQASLAKGRSDLAQAKANLELARMTWERYKFLVQQGAVTQEQADTELASYKANLASVSSAENTVNVDIANVKAAEDSIKSSQANLRAYVASVSSSQSNLHRYEVLQSFEKVTAPYTGVITARYIDKGDLITTGSSNNTNLFKLAQIDPVDVNVDVPQSEVSSVQLGQIAKIRVPQLRNRVFEGKIVRTADALNPSSRTLLTQIEVQNPEGALQTGMSTDVRFTFTRANPPLIVPDNVLVFNAGGMQVATVTKDQKVHFQKIVLGRDYGQEAEVLSGLQGDEQLIVNPTTNLVEGTPVKIKQPQTVEKSDKPEALKSK